MGRNGPINEHVLGIRSAKLLDYSENSSVGKESKLLYENRYAKCERTTGPNSSCWSYAASSSGYESVSGLNSGSTEQDSDHESDDSSDGDSDWGEDEWPCDRALPLPEWGTERPELFFEDIYTYKQFEALAAEKLKENIVSFPYDTLSNFLTFSYEYYSQKDDYSSLHEFFRDYDPPLLHERFTCVGLSINLMTKMSSLEDLYPGLKDAMYQVSCEEEIDQIDSYCTNGSPPVTTCEKEHVLVCIRVRMGDRTGVLLLDPGYHVAQPITVMNDSLYPHTREMNVSKKDSVGKFYIYNFHVNPAFVLWNVVERKEGVKTSNRFSLIHVTRPFLSAIDIAERRNLVYPFKTLLHRNDKGELIAGLYFPIRAVDKTKVTMFYLDEHNKRCDVKIPLSFFLCQDLEDEENRIYETVLKEVEARSFHGRSIRSYLRLVATLLKDENFLNEFIQLNNDVDKISRDN